MDKQKEYLDKVVNRMVSETEISKHKRYSSESGFWTSTPLMRTPFSDSLFRESQFIEMKELLQHLKWFPAGKLSHHFTLYVKDIYALSKKEIPYAFEKYVDAIILKVNE